MKHIILYKPDGLKTLEFKFNEPVISFNSNMGWASISASGRSITICGQPFLCYDEDIAHNFILSDFSDVWKYEISDAYKEGNKVIVIFQKDGTPILMLWGNNLSLKKDGDINIFSIENKDIYLYDMPFLILSKNS